MHGFFSEVSTGDLGILVRFGVNCMLLLRFQFVKIQCSIAKRDQSLRLALDVQVGYFLRKLSFSVCLFCFLSLCGFSVDFILLMLVCSCVYGNFETIVVETASLLKEPASVVLFFNLLACRQTVCNGVAACVGRMCRMLLQVLRPSSNNLFFFPSVYCLFQLTLICASVSYSSDPTFFANLMCFSFPDHMKHIMFAYLIVSCKEAKKSGEWRSLGVSALPRGLMGILFLLQMNGE